MRLFMLDMGEEKYGDCIVVAEAGKTILVDGGHPRDFRQRWPSTPSIPDQLARVLGQRRPPFRVSLLVVTHCHADHIGCLPTLVGDGTLEAEWALVADERLGYPKDDGEDEGRDAVDDALVAALREEPRGDFRSRAELDEFLQDAGTIEERYRAMLATLEERGTRVVRYTGRDAAVEELEEAFADTGLRVLGPTQEQLLLCTRAIAAFSRGARDAVAAARDAAPSLDAAGALPELLLTRRGAARLDATPLPDAARDFLDRPGKGAALNDQSIVLKVGLGLDTALLTGDMQLAKPEVEGLDRPMRGLLRAVAAAGPYAFCKVGHHASDDAFDGRVLRALGATRAFGVSTGRGDPGHPDPEVLALLRENAGRLGWSRTDKNGLVAVTIEDGRARMRPDRGELDDPDSNLAEDAPAGGGAVAASPATPGPAEVPPGPDPDPTAARVTRSFGGDGAIELHARIPHVATRVTITVEVEPREAAGAGGPASRRPEEPRPGPGRAARPDPGDRAALGGGRSLPPLLFVTATDRLAANVGAVEAGQALGLVRAAGQRALELRRADDPFPEVRQALGDARGVVLLGGYDVLPALRYDTVPEDLRRRLGRHGDPDDFVVWSDQAYGCADGDGLGELPVSRIPDGRSAALVLAALRARAEGARGHRFGLRNVARPFAASVFEEHVPGREAILVSEPAAAGGIDAASVDAAAIYLMLHGLDTDTSRFWGETAEGGDTVEALDTGNVPDPCGGTVLAGCCWGALTVRGRASRHRPGGPVQSLTPEQSVALAFLRRGARAFVGCTGAHYSPVADEGGEHDGGLDYFGAPMHRAFWARVRAGEAPAAALFGAKTDYMRGMPHGRRSLEERAIEYKILRQFTCLGLGW